MLEISAMPLSDPGFSVFGSIYHLKALGTPTTEERSVVRSRGEGWLDAYTKMPLISTNGSLGLTLGEGGDFLSNQMERHQATQEALFCAADPIVLAVAPPSVEERPQAKDVRAFIIEPGTVVVLHHGTWHDACRGLDKPVYYYWMATTGSGSDWVDVVGGPVLVRTGKPEKRDA